MARSAPEQAVRQRAWSQAARPRSRDPAGRPADAAGWCRTPRRDPGRVDRAGEAGGGRGDSRGSDPRGRDPGWTGREPGPRRAGGDGWDPGPPARRGGDPGADAQTRRMPASRGSRGDGSLPREARGDGSPRDKQQGVPGGRPPGSTPPTGTRSAMTQPRGISDGAAQGPGGPRDSRGRRNSPPPRGPRRIRRWGTLQGGLGVCVIVASAAVGAILTIAGPERARFPARTLRRGRHSGRLAGRPAQGRPDDLPRPGALLPGGRPAEAGSYSTGPPIRPRPHWPSARRSGSLTASSRWRSPPC